MTPGLTGYLLSHEQTRCLITRETGDDWGRSFLLLLTIVVLLTGGALIVGIGKADQVTTSVTSDSSVMSFSAYRSGDTTIIGRFFGSGRTSIGREIETGDRLSHLISKSDGPLLIGLYASSEDEQKDPPVACVFGNGTLFGRIVATGNLSVNEEIKMDQGEEP